MPCPDDDTIVDLLAGRLDDAARRALLVHLDDCDECRHLIADAGALDGEAAPDRGDPDDALLGRGAAIGRYLVSRVLGVGAMGVVYAAHDPQLGRDVAIKLLRRDAIEPHRRIGDRPAADARDVMLREAQTVARLSHPNVVAIHDADVHDGQVFLVMELVDGRTLRAWLAEAPRAWPELRDVFVQVGRGLEAAHASGLVHRDVKPDNILVGRDGRVRVTDFGLARWAHAGPRPSAAAIARAAQRSSTSLVGTPAYMSPEQLAGLRVDARSDLFAYCVTLYEAVYGARPFDGRIFEGPAPTPPVLPAVTAPPGHGVPARARRALERGLASDREARPASMTELLAALDHRAPIGAIRVAVGAAAVAAAVAAVVLFTRRGAADPCTGTDAAWGDVWDGAQQQAARARFLGSKRPDAADQFAQLDHALGGYRRDWLAMHHAACTAHARGEQSSELLDRRMSCLDAHRAAARDIATQVLANDVVGEVQEAASYARQLSPIGDCADARDGAQASARLEPVQSPTAVIDGDGKLRVYVVGAGGAVWGVREETTGNPPTWGPWQRMGDVADLRTVVAEHHHGTLTLTGIDARGVLRGAYEQAGDALALSTWGRVADGDVVDFAMALDASDREHTFRIVRGADGATSLAQIEEVAPGSGPAPEVVLDRADPERVVAINDGLDGKGALHVFVSGKGWVWHLWQLEPHGEWYGPYSLPGRIDVAQLAVALNGDRRLEVFALDRGGRAFHQFVIDPAADPADAHAWSDWQPLGTPNDLRALRLIREGKGLYAAGLTVDGAVIALWQHDRLSVWNDWWETVPVDRSMKQITDVALANDGAGNKFELAVAAGRLWLRWADRPGSGQWHGWMLL